VLLVDHRPAGECLLDVGPAGPARYGPRRPGWNANSNIVAFGAAAAVTPAAMMARCASVSMGLTCSGSDADISAMPTM